MNQFKAEPLARELLMMERMLGLAMSFRRAVGTVSRREIAGFMVATIFVRDG